jgi:dienelactone hydrolase
MRSPLLVVLVLLGSALLAAPAMGAEPGPGKTVTVTCKDASDQRYACYLPSKYTRDKSWPILYCFSPNANGDAFVQRYRKVCEERGWIVVGSMNSRNGPWEPIQKAIDAMWADAEARFNLSKTMRYASGFSGGARVSFALAEMKPENVSGVIAIGAGMHSSARAPKKTLACFLMCGETDPNKRELDPLSKRLKEAGNLVHYENFPGGHVMPRVDLMEKAVRWMDDQAVERKAERLAAAVAEAKRLVGEEKLVEAWRALATTLEALPDVKEGRKEAEKLLKDLARKPAVKPEIQAQKELVKAEGFLTKYADRIQRFKAKRDEARKKLNRIVDRWPDTLAAQAARKHLEALDAIEAD